VSYAKTQMKVYFSLFVFHVSHICVSWIQLWNSEFLDTFFSPSGLTSWTFATTVSSEHTRFPRFLFVVFPLLLLCTVLCTILNWLSVSFSTHAN